jgi:hypothetical protein
MASKRCPHCGLVNPGTAEGCDCGYSFANGSVGKPLDLSKPGAPIERQPVSHNVPDARYTPTVIFLGLLLTAVIVALRIALRR